jgi:hypothetical protein
VCHEIRRDIEETKEFGIDVSGLTDKLGILSNGETMKKLRPRHCLTLTPN